MQWNKLQNTSQINVCDKIWVTRPPASEATAVAPAPASGYHVVQKGETLYGIARKYNLTEATIREYNKFPASGKVNIIPGQKIAVTKSQAPEKTAVNNSAKSTTPVENRPAAAPPAAPAAAGLPAGRLSYKVKKGETLSMIAWNVGYTAPYLRHINKNINTLPATDNEPLPEGLLLVVSDSKGDREDLSTFVPPVAAPGTYPSSQNVAVTAPPVSYEYIGEYIVQNDDTLASIAQQYGLAPEKLAAANNLKPGQQPAPRSILKIPK
jgi:LysM repeat protein